MKKVLVFGLILIMALVSTVGCSGDQEAADPNGEGQEEQQQKLRHPETAIIRHNLSKCCRALIQAVEAMHWRS